MNLSESIHGIILLLIDLGILSGSLGVVLLANVVHSAFPLGLVLICISLSYLVLNADFVAAAQLLIYVGAINVLIVFSVMVIDKPTDSHSSTSWKIGDATTSGACTGLFLLLTIMIQDTKWSNISLNEQSKTIAEETSRNNIQKIGYQLLTNFLLPFELLSILLLVALIGAITMARNEQIIRTDKKTNSSSRENSSSF
uniref:NAD(P)H-quinone oxidoreductase subunit 6, chloroplastic n=1 Tax=Hymenophyllum holochilum TaxID=2137820 RepID=A0A385KP86_9MONI|nr:NADH-plastoquinone oxidoreductase subunit 6 [Hymenophyllum holochilum]AXZ97005.1 NADH-plastoquinone oxidoreductase subunit 6 [Hymenophyllum holochilum]